jgi:uncharacterized protein CbrC (UPF0167 family)
MHPLHTFDQQLLQLRDATYNLKKEFTIDNFTQMMVVAYSLIDRIIVEFPQLTPAIQIFRQDHHIKLCRDICNFYKHANLDKTKNPVLIDISSQELGWGQFPWGVGRWGDGAHDISITDNTGTIHSGITIASKVYSNWKQFIQHNMSTYSNIL